MRDTILKLDPRIYQKMQGQHSIEPPMPFANPTVSSDFACDLEDLFGLRVQYHNHPLIGFLTINSLRYKVLHLSIIFEKFLPDTLVIEETKLDSEFNKKHFDE